MCSAVCYYSSDQNCSSSHYNNVHFKIRFSKKNIILAGLWCSREKPPMNVFLKPLIESLNDLFNNGNVGGGGGVKMVGLVGVG